eukprot:TRINITY_DN9332_c0_g1_i1.p1 TRINITY_DN9332_c0_g1~~TRINITY_DN9332_c0_g1_i1.p1  ORF type:complete len:400 (+),score=117.46 TRINITY_DN9332_c0_g1_i1:62-1201(+)
MAPQQVGLCMVGFGAVGKALATMLDDKRGSLADLGVSFVVVGVCTKRCGSVVKPLSEGGVDMAAVRRLHGDALSIAAAGNSGPSDPCDFVAEAAAAGAGVLVEAIPVDYETGEPAVSILRAGIQQGMHCVTANKGPVVHAVDSLSDAAAEKGVRFLFESAVMDGVPIFNMARHCLPTAKVTGFTGLLNSTTNIILSEMERGSSFDAALAKAQAEGIAEADPSGDIDGWDAAVKVAALCTVLLQRRVKPADVSVQGIRGVTRERVAEVCSGGRKLKLLCAAEATPDGVSARVALEEVGPGTVWFALQGASSAVEIRTDVMGPVTVVSTDPTNSDTAFGVLADCVEAVLPGHSVAQTATSDAQRRSALHSVSAALRRQIDA